MHMTALPQSRDGSYRCLPTVSHSLEAMTSAVDSVALAGSNLCAANVAVSVVPPAGQRITDGSFRAGAELGDQLV